MSWEVASEHIEDWGRLQVVIGGNDLTFYRDIPTIVNGWGTAEPFSDTNATITFPGITSFEEIADLPFSKYDDVAIQHVHPTTNEVLKNLFEGFIVSIDDDLSGNSNALTVECLGAMFQADFMIKTPTFNDYNFDSAAAIKEELDTRIDHYGLRLKPLTQHTYSNIESRNRGSFNPLLTGWIQELLSKSYTQAFMIENEEAVAISWNPTGDPDGYMITGNFGSFISFGEDFPNWGSWSYLIEFLIWFDDNPRRAFADTALLPDGTGLYAVTQDGQVIFLSDDSFGDPSKNLGDIQGHWWEVKAIQVTPTGEGYYLMDSHGIVHPFGDAVKRGTSPWPLDPSFTRPDEFVDMALTPSGEGYYLLTKYGWIYSYGDATDFSPLNVASLDDFVTTAVAIVAYEDGAWVLASDGEIFAFSWTGSVPHLGDIYTRIANGEPVELYGEAPHVDLEKNPPNIPAPDGIPREGSGYAMLRSDGHVTHYNMWDGYGFAQYSLNPSAGGNVYQWTLMKDPGRQLRMSVKNVWTNHWSISVGTPGVSHSLTRDWTANPNVFFGEGIDDQNCRWRNTKYPNIRPDDAPIWPGYNFSLTQNQNAPAVTQWQERMIWFGYRHVGLTVDGHFGQVDAYAARLFQHRHGITADGVVGAQTWAAVFEVGESQGDASNAYYAPIAFDPEVEPFIYSSANTIKGPNPSFDKSLMRIETFENYGEGISQADATISARARMKRGAFNEEASNAGYFGTITLTSDPAEGSRFDIRAGENILYKNYRGQDTRFHISAVDIDMNSLSVTLTVDTEARDAMTIANLIQRNKESNEVGNIRTRRLGMGTTVEDRIAVWDCANGAGVIPRHGIAAGAWNVLRIPVGEFGEVVQTHIKTDIPAELSVAVFDRPIYANELRDLGDPRDEDYWKNFPEYKGLVVSWGGFENMAGYYPGRQSDEDPKTGVLLDRASWVYWTTERPWIWVALWSEFTTYIQGRLYPGTEGVGLVPDISSLPEIT